MIPFASDWSIQITDKSTASTFASIPYSKVPVGVLFWKKREHGYLRCSMRVSFSDGKIHANRTSSLGTETSHASFPESYRFYEDILVEKILSSKGI